jgi:predicted CoA-binding protein
MFSNPSAADISKLLSSARTIAIVGLSPDPDRPSHRVARALKQFGYRIIPVNPNARTILGEPALPDLDALEPAAAIDIVDVFRRPDEVGPIVDACIRRGLPALWLQEGVVDEPSAERARSAGIFTVMDRCILRERAALGQGAGIRV